MGEIARKFKRGGGTGTGTYDEKGRALHRGKDDGEGTATLRECTTELHGGVYHRTSTPLKDEEEGGRSFLLLKMRCHNRFIESGYYYLPCCL